MSDTAAFPGLDLPRLQDDSAHAREALPDALEHGLRPHFETLARFNSTREMMKSELYARLRPEIERVLSAVVQEDFAPRTDAREVDARSASLSSSTVPTSIRATAWNIERGKQFEGVVRALAEETSMSRSDVLLLTELDYGMARTGNLHVARELARALGMNYAFAPCYLALTKGSGVENRAEGENAQALHGNAVLSRHRLSNAHAVALPNGKDKMRGKEKRLGSQRAVVADVMHPAGAFRVVSLHLDAHSSQRHRARQMRLVLEHLERLAPRLPVLLGGDWNTSTYNSRRAVYSIAGYFRRVAMGVRNVIVNHYPHPDRWFERRLFREIERRGFLYRELNETGAGTLHYDIKDLAAYENMREWVPRWCFWFIEWALRQNDGRCSLKLDWFAGRGLTPLKDSPPKVIGGLSKTYGPLSDHDPVFLEFTLDAWAEKASEGKILTRFENLSS